MNYDGQRLCAVSDTEAVGQMCKWPTGNISWTLQAQLSQFDKQTLVAAIDLAWSYLRAVCAVNPVFQDGNNSANIVIGTQTISPGGVLADMELPCGVSSQSTRRMRIDTADAWTISENPPADKVDIVRVICHELGHGIGVPHIGTGNLMAPVYSRQIRKPQPGDIAEFVARYGLPNQPPPEPIPPPADYEEILAYLLKDNQLYVRTKGIVRKIT